MSIQRSDAPVRIRSIHIAMNSPTPAPTVAFVKKLQYNKSKGEEVKLVQTRLTELGYYSGNISGNFLSCCNVNMACDYLTAESNCLVLNPCFAGNRVSLFARAGFLSAA